jgi:hypothetical protein
MSTPEEINAERKKEGTVLTILFVLVVGFGIWGAYAKKQKVVNITSVISMFLAGIVVAWAFARAGKDADGNMQVWDKKYDDGLTPSTLAMVIVAAWIVIYGFLAPVGMSHV